MSFTDVSTALLRLRWQLAALKVEAKHLQYVIALKAGFNPNQPRASAGTREGGQWIGSASATTDISATRRTRGGPIGIRIGGRSFRASFEQSVRYDRAEARAQVAIRQVRERDPNWRPTPELFDTTEGAIRSTEAMARQAEARLAELQYYGIGPGRYAGESIPARGPGRDFYVGEHREINQIGEKTGCHTCGTFDPRTTSGNYVVDHQPPTRWNPGGALQRLYPQCLLCSLRQGGWIKSRQSKQ